MGSEELAADDKVFKDILAEKLMRACDASILGLVVMTAAHISKELVVEDLVEQVAVFVKCHMQQVLFAAYDPVYKGATSTSTTTHSASNAATTTTTTTTSTKRKLLGQFTAGNQHSPAGGGGSTAANVAKHAHHYYNRMREILCLLAELVAQIDMTDTIVITLCSLSVACFFVDNVSELQLEALKLLTALCARYPAHRQLIYDDLLNSVFKLHASNKRAARVAYKCFNGDSIQMFTALLLQLLQCEVTSLGADGSVVNLFSTKHEILTRQKCKLEIKYNKFN